MWMGDCLSIIRAIFTDISEIGIWELGVEQVKRCVACMQNKRLSQSGSVRLVEFENGGGPAGGGSQPLGTFGSLRNRCCDILGQAFQHIFVPHAFDMYLRCCVAGIFFVSSAKINICRGTGVYFNRKYRIHTSLGWVWLKR